MFSLSFWKERDTSLTKLGKFYGYNFDFPHCCMCVYFRITYITHSEPFCGWVGDELCSRGRRAATFVGHTLRSSIQFSHCLWTWNNTLWNNTLSRVSGIAQHPKHSKFHLVLDLGTVKLDTNSIHSETQGVPQNTEYEKGFKKVVADIISPSFYVI